MGYLIEMMMLMFCINFGLGLAGYTSAAQTMVYGGNSLTSVQGVQNMVWALIGAFGLIAGAAIAGGALSSNFGLIYTIPIALLGVVLTFIMSPLSFLNEVAMPAEIKTLFLGIFGIALIGGVLSFIRGGDA
jgi:hypothetical protein